MNLRIYNELDFENGSYQEIDLGESIRLLSDAITISAKITATLTHQGELIEEIFPEDFDEAAIEEAAALNDRISELIDKLENIQSFTAPEDSEELYDYSSLSYFSGKDKIDVTAYREER